MSTNDQRCVKRGVSSTHCGNNRDLKVQTSAHACEKPFRCGMCLKCFSCKTKVKHHIRIHSGEGPHQCEVCKKCLHPSSGLKKHMSVHAGVKNFTSQYMLRSGKQKASKTLAATEALPLARRKTKHKTAHHHLPPQ
ncbi:oocyte zinc finger protein XlCOF7.1-like [Gigantopelta aegis]|uniref:oocyte zinc finger protein XlCOF7.1-like n=1 Tax=Gigantopelta aegis TaxID=1735272 RepID=UPI001B88D0FF|nr:oocyte zinc finger protein XlCOF7.1-like [Gigantopelta aegis]